MLEQVAHITSVFYKVTDFYLITGTTEPCFKLSINEVVLVIGTASSGRFWFYLSHTVHKIEIHVEDISKRRRFYCLGKYIHGRCFSKYENNIINFLRKTLFRSISIKGKLVVKVPVFWDMTVHSVTDIAEILVLSPPR
jgi:transposase